MRRSAPLILFLALPALGCKPEPAPLPDPEPGDALGSPARPAEESIIGTQYVDMASYRLQVIGLVKSSGAYTYEEVLQGPASAKLVEHHCIKGWMERLRYEGVLVRDLFEARPGANTVVRFPDAHAATGELTRLRHELWQARPTGARPPSVFRGYDTARVEDDATFTGLRPGGRRPLALVGRTVDVDGTTFYPD